MVHSDCRSEGDRMRAEKEDSVYQGERPGIIHFPATVGDRRTLSFLNLSLSLSSAARAVSHFSSVSLVVLAIGPESLPNKSGI